MSYCPSKFQLFRWLSHSFPLNLPQVPVAVYSHGILPFWIHKPLSHDVPCLVCLSPHHTLRLNTLQERNHSSQHELSMLQNGCTLDILDRQNHTQFQAQSRLIIIHDTRCSTQSIYSQMFVAFRASFRVLVEISCDEVKTKDGFVISTQPWLF